MRLRVQDKIEAIRLRKLGYTYSEIRKVIPVSKSLLSGWFRGVQMTEEEVFLLDTEISKQVLIGRINASNTNHRRRLDRDKIVFESAQKSFELFKHDSFFILGISLYWAEGGKKVSCFQFINSDPEMLRMMIRWIEKYFNYPKECLKYRLFMHELYANENCENYWAQAVGVPRDLFQKTIYKPTAHTVKKNSEYKGCLRVSFGGVTELRTVLAWQKLLIEYYR
ncbi:MAG: hypothetical protein AAB447_01975 [Patescibacteria group bacterium]